MLLAVDTSTEQASIALADRGRIRAEWSWTAERNHSRHLTHAIGQLLALEGIVPASLTAVIVAIGPGSFSGVRVGLSEAKGLGLALSVSVVGISTLDAIAFAASAVSRDVWAILPAGRGEVALARYAGPPETWRRVGPYLLLRVDEAARMVQGSQMLAGPGAEDVARAAAERGEKPRVLAGPWSLRRAGYLAELGRRYLEAGGRDQRAELEPLYLRPSAAEEKRRSQRQE